MKKTIFIILSLTILIGCVNKKQEVLYKDKTESQLAEYESEAVKLHSQMKMFYEKNDFIKCRDVYTEMKNSYADSQLFIEVKSMYESFVTSEPKRESTTLASFNTNEVYGINCNGTKLFVMTAPHNKGERKLNQKATNYYKSNVYYHLSSNDKVYVMAEDKDWVKIKHTVFPDRNNGWIQKKYVVEVGLSNHSSDNNYKYHSKGKKKQQRYQGSLEQKKDLKEIDEYAKNHPDF
jgi:hypothetical protein